MAMREQSVKVITDHGPLGWVFFMAWLGAVVYFYQLQPGLWGLILAIIKGAAWPGFVVYHALRLVGA